MAAKTEGRTMVDHELVEWFLYVAIGLGALIAHTVLTALR
jgi:hypothetical protein